MAFRFSRGFSRHRSIKAAVRSSAAQVVEQLENRTLLTVTLDANGWTDVTPTPGVSKLIYVSSSIGSNSNNGLSPSAPVQTIAYAQTLISNNEPDWILLKRGDTFTGEVTLSMSGLSAQQPMVFTDYGDTSLPRPVVDGDGATYALNMSSHLDNYVDVIGITFTSSTADPSSPDFNGTQNYGLDDLGTSNMLVEDCSFSFFIDDLVFQSAYGQVSNITVRRCEILDAYCTTGHAEGLYAETTNNLTLDQNVFDHDGWIAGVTGGGATGYNQGCYIHSSCNNCVITNNIFSDSGSVGLQARAGGIVDNNLFIDNPYGFSFGLVNGATTKAGGVTGEAIGNVVIEPRVDTVNSYGIAAMIGNLAVGGGTVISDNIFAHETGSQPAVEFAPGNGVSNVAQEVGLNSLTFSDNTVYNWGYGLYMDTAYVDGSTGHDGLTDVTIENNQFQGNTTRIISHNNAYSSSQEAWSGNTYSSTTTPSDWFYLNGSTTSFANWKSTVEPTAVSATLAYPDPNRTVETYMASQGLTNTIAAFIAGERSLSATNWDPTYLASTVIGYIRAGFSLNSNPTIALTGNSHANVGGTYTLNLGAVNDPGQTVTQYTVDWGDGTTPDVYTAGGQVTHTFATAGPSTISVSLTDGTGTHSGAGTLAVSVAQPSAGLSGNAVAVVGQAYQLTLDPTADLGGSPTQYTVNWGDGTSTVYTNTTGTTPILASHVFTSAAADDSIAVDLVDNTGTFLDASSKSIAVGDAPSVTVNGASNTNVGAVYTFTLSSVNDPNGTVSSYIIHWGDNSTSTATSLGDVTHTYSKAGDDNIVVDIVDQNGTFAGAGSLGVTVNQPTLAVSGGPLVALNQAYSLTLGALFDPAETVTSYNINWGDGQSTAATATGIVQHTYTTAGKKTISVSFTDGIGTYSAGPLPVLVTAAPTLPLSGNADANAGGTYTLTLGTIADSNGTPSQYLVHWGDGSTSASGAAGNLTHTYSQTGPATISVDVTDPGGIWSAVASKSITVNPPPKIALSGASTVAANTAYSLTLGTVTDPGYTVSQYTVHWGDGTTSTYTSAGAMTHTYTSAQTAAITVDLKDSTGTYTSAGSLSVTVTSTIIALTHSVDIGSPKIAGKASVSNGVYTVTGSGSDIYNTSDQFHYDYANVTGNVTIAAKVTSVQNTNSWAKAGVMIRASTAANSAFADVVVTPAGYVSFQWRTKTGAAATDVVLTGKTIPQYVKLTRSGSTFTAWYSSNGTTWIQIGKAVTITMTSAVTTGLAVTSVNTSKSCTATFSNVSVG